MTDNDTIDVEYPVDPIEDAKYEAAADVWDQDLDSLCVHVSLVETVRRGLCDLYGEDYFADADYDDDDCAFKDDALRAVNALILAGLLRACDYSYDDVVGALHVP